jgi:hypothetical protein
VITPRKPYPLSIFYGFSLSLPTEALRDGGSLSRPVVRRLVGTFPPSVLFGIASVSAGLKGQVHKPAALSLAFTPFRFAVALFFFAVRVHGYPRSGTWVQDSRFKIQKKESLSYICNLIIISSY